MKNGLDKGPNKKANKRANMRRGKKFQDVEITKFTLIKVPIF